MEPPIESKYGAHNYFVYDTSLIKCIKGHYMLIASIFSSIIIAASLVNFAYGQASQMDPTRNNNTNANSLDIQNIMVKKFMWEI